MSLVAKQPPMASVARNLPVLALVAQKQPIPALASPSRRVTTPVAT